MSGQSPSSVLYSSDGYELATVSGSPIIAGTRALLISGSDPTGNARYVPTTINGALGSAEMSNSFIVQSAAIVTASGSQLVTSNFFGTQEIAIVVNVGTVTGAGSIVYTIQEVDPGDLTTVYGSTASTVSISTGNAPGVFTAVLNVTTSSAVKVSWVVTGSFSATIYTTLTTKATPSTQTISGSITATNPSVGTDNAAALGFDTQVGGIVTLNNPTYTAGNLRALSLTTEGGLRVFTDGYATTAAPTYTTNTSNPLSLTTAGELRVLANQGTSPWVVSGTVTANQGTSPWVTSVTGTVAVTQSTSPWVTSGTGNGFNNQSVGTDAAAALGFDTQVGGIVSTAAPTYTNGNLDALSLTTAGALRVDASGTTLTVTTNKASTSAVTNVASSASSVTLLSANAARLFASVYNDSSKTVFIKLGTTASNTSFSILLMPNSYWEVPVDYTGRIDAIWSSANGNARVTELTP